MCRTSKIRVTIGNQPLVSCVPSKKQTFLAGIVIDEQHLTVMHLCRRKQSCNWVDHMPLDSSLQAAPSIPLVGSFLQEELPAFLGDSK